jgi:hypothetical protein
VAVTGATAGGALGGGAEVRAPGARTRTGDWAGTGTPSVWATSTGWPAKASGSSVAFPSTRGTAISPRPSSPMMATARAEAKTGPATSLPPGPMATLPLHGQQVSRPRVA